LRARRPQGAKLSLRYPALRRLFVQDHLPLHRHFPLTLLLQKH
jgi:hypothetical protein